MASIGVDANPITRTVRTGTEVYALELCRRLPDAAPDLDWRFYASRPAPGLGVDLTVLPGRRLWTQVRLAAELATRPPELLFVPSHVPPFLSRTPFVATIHDVAFDRFPSAYPGGALAYLRCTTFFTTRRAQLVLTVSESTRQDLIDLYGVNPDRVRVVHPGGGEGAAPPPETGDQARLEALGIDRPFALHVGRIETKKNQLAALEAVARVPGLVLVCAGAEADAALAARLRSSPAARILGPVADEVRDLLYRNASVLLFPSIYEGFGFPIVEAMRHGLPVVASRNSSLPEIGGDAALYVDDPHDAGELAAAVRCVLEDSGLQRRLASAGRRQAVLFSWERCAAGVADALRSCL